MSRLIDADDLKETLKYLWKLYGDDETKIMVTSAIDHQPTISSETKPIRHGKWIMSSHGPYCSKCGTEPEGIPSPYCPHCGAKMDGVI